MGSCPWNLRPFQPRWPVLQKPMIFPKRWEAGEDPPSVVVAPSAGPEKPALGRPGRCHGGRGRWAAANGDFLSCLAWDWPTNPTTNDVAALTC